MRKILFSNLFFAGLISGLLKPSEFMKTLKSLFSFSRSSNLPTKVVFGSRPGNLIAPVLLRKISQSAIAATRLKADSPKLTQDLKIEIFISIDNRFVTKLFFHDFTATSSINLMDTVYGLRHLFNGVT